MRYPATTSAALVVTFFLATCTSNAFVFTAPFHNLVAASQRRERTKYLGDITCVAKGVAVSCAERSGAVSGGTYDRAIAPSSSRRFKRTWTRVTKLSGARNEGQWEPLTPSLAGSSPEELMRKMSIPDLAQKLEQAESTFGAVHPQVAAALIPLAQALFANGDIGPARETCTRALKILQVAYGSTPSVEVAECLHTLAMIQQAESPRLGELALTSQNMALELATRVCGPTSIEVAAYSRCLAQMSEDYGKHLEPGLPRPFYMPHPVPLYRQTLKILEEVLGPNDAEVASALDDLTGALLFWRDDEFSDEVAVTLLPEAKELAIRSLEISRACLGEDRTTAGREHNLGMVNRGLGREEDARTHFERALEIREKVLGADHPLTKDSRQVLQDPEGPFPPADDDDAQAFRVS